MRPTKKLTPRFVSGSRSLATMETIDAVWIGLAGLVAVLGVFLLSGLHFSSVPGPVWTIPLIGETIDFTLSPLLFFYRRFKLYNSPPFFRSYIFGKEFYIIGNIGLYKKIMTHEHAQFTLPLDSARAIMNVYSSEHAPTHLIFRKWMAQALSPLNLKARIPKMQEILIRHVEGWLSQGDNVSFAIDSLCRHAVIEIAISALAGLDIPPFTMEKLSSLAMDTQRGLFAPPINLPGFLFHKALKTRPHYKRLIEVVIKARFQIDPDTGGVVVPPLEEGNMSTTQATLMEFADRKEIPTPDKLSERLIANAVGASETTGGVLFSTILAVGIISGLMDKLRMEQQEVLEKHGETMTYDLLQTAMPLLDATVREATRVLPSAHTVFRQATEDIEIGEHTFKKGSHILLAFDLLHALDEAFGVSERVENPKTKVPLHVDPDQLPDSFRPERWLEAGVPRPNVTIFGYGNHSCLGMNIALAEIKMCVALLVRRGTWTVNDPAPVFKFLPMLRLDSGPAKIRFRKQPL